MGSKSQESEFIEHLHAEKLRTQEARTKYTLNKLAYATALLGLGSLSVEIKSVDFRWLLYLVPFVALAFDFYIMGEDYSVKRLGAFLRANSADALEQQWEKWVSRKRDPFAPLAMPILTSLLLLGATVVVVSIDKGTVVQSPWFWIWFAVSELLSWGCFAFYRSMRKRVLQSVPGAVNGGSQPARHLHQLIAAVASADCQLNEATYRRVQWLFTSCLSDPLRLQCIQRMAPEYSRPEFLLCVDRQGKPIATTERVIKEFRKTYARYPDFALWFREVKLPDSGEPTLLVARWLCHLVGFRHTTVHLFIDHPTLTDYTLVQVRAVEKAESPGCFDLPAAGHVSGLGSVEETLFAELAEELHLGRDALRDLTRVGSYEYQQPPDQPGLRNTEYRVVFQSRLNADDWLKVYGASQEVAAVAVFSIAELEGITLNFPERVASGLRASFPLYLRHEVQTNG